MAGFWTHAAIGQGERRVGDPSGPQRPKIVPKVHRSQGMTPKNQAVGVMDLRRHAERFVIDNLKQPKTLDPNRSWLDPFP